MTCTNIGRITLNVSTIQAIRINNKSCDEATIWTLSEAYGGQSYVTDFTIENTTNMSFNINAAFNAAPDNEYTIEILDDANEPIIFPYAIDSHAFLNWKLRISINKYVSNGELTIDTIFDFAS